MALHQIQRKYSKFISDVCKNSSKIGLHRNRIEESDLHTFHCKRSYTYINDDPIPPAPHKYKFDEGEHDDGDQRWFHNPKCVGFTLFFFTCGALLGLASGKSVTVPYSERSHFILFHTLGSKAKNFPLFIQITSPLEESFRIYSIRLCRSKSRLGGHIGLMLAASGGYDPVTGLMYPVYMGELKQSVLPEFLSIFPTGRKRNMYLARPQILNEAIYKASGSTDSTEA